MDEVEVEDEVDVEVDVDVDEVEVDVEVDVGSIPIRAIKPNHISPSFILSGKLVKYAIALGAMFKNTDKVHIIFEFFIYIEYN